ncbi:AmmeMemoRadiSam system protein B [candidate division KSB1 bacterium]|nr:AmmeMemoRadiSam system protein B [candidate division KSB1 bacterium]
MEKPKLRAVEPIPVEIEGKPMVALRDPGRIAPEMLVVSHELIFILQFFDGEHTCLDIRQRYLQQFNNFLYADQLDKIIQDLDARLYLESEHFQQHQAALLRQYRSQPTRPAAHAGQSYPAEPEILRQKLTAFFNGENGPGLPVPGTHTTAVKAIVAPHIDLQAGGSTFAYAYKALAEAPPADVYLILGTGHNGIAQAFACSDKDFETPLGLVHTDRDFLAELQTLWAPNLFAEELIHQYEHTIEFQTIFLQFLFGNRPGWKIVPILCSFNHAMLQMPDFQCIENFLAALKQVIQRSSRRICLIASADLAHVGSRYGDTFQPDQPFLLELNRTDHQTLAHVEKSDLAQFVQAVAADDQRRHICGFPPIYAMLRLLGSGTTGKLLKYAQVPVDTQNSTVSFASMVFYE